MMERRIETERRGRTPESIKSLILDYCLLEPDERFKIPCILHTFVNLEELRMINVGLCSVFGFPILNQLKILDVSDNRLSGGLNHIADGCPKLTILNLGGNPIKEMDSLDPLKNLVDLYSVDLAECHIAKAEDYRNKVFDILPQITYLDSFDFNGEGSAEPFESHSGAEAEQVFDGRHSDDDSLPELVEDTGMMEKGIDGDSYMADASSADEGGAEISEENDSVENDDEEGSEMNDEDAEMNEEDAEMNEEDAEMNEKGAEMNERYGQETVGRRLRPRRGLKRARYVYNDGDSSEDGL